MSQNALKSKAMISPLERQRQLAATPLGKYLNGNMSGSLGSSSKNLVFTMNLTTLIDAFCILVIFLLSNMNGQLQNINLSKNSQLPLSYQSEILKTGVVVRVENDNYFVDDQKVEFLNLSEKLYKSKGELKNSLIIQADRNSDYEKISALLRMGGQVGYDKFAFAVLPTGR